MKYLKHFENNNILTGYNCIFEVKFKKPKKILMAGSLLSCGFLGWD